VHDFKWSEQTQGQALSIAAPLLSRISFALGNTGNTLKTPAVHNLDHSQFLLESLFNSICEEYQQQHDSRELMLETLLTTLILSIKRLAEPSAIKIEAADRSHRHFLAFGQLLEKYYSQHWTVADYAAQLGISAPHLNSICRKLRQQSALSIIHQRLLLEAKRSLRYTGRTIAEIAYQLGFSEPSHFTRFFKNKMEKSPKEFREQNSS
jgi:AraC family transcriptional activator of pobA